MPHGDSLRTYSIHVAAKDIDGVRRVEFDAPGTEGLISQVRTLCRDGEVTIFENNRKLASLKICEPEGFLVIVR
jgi:hypothetical protein